MTLAVRRAVVALILIAGSGGCQKSDQPAPAPIPARPSMVVAGPGPVDQVVRAAIADADEAGELIVVYVGAEWCEPCKRFKQALVDGQFDEEFAGVRFLEFDDDRDAERLAAAGYHGDMLPRFVVPALDGRGTARRIEGSIKGPGSPAEIAPRLADLLRGRG